MVDFDVRRRDGNQAIGSLAHGSLTAGLRESAYNIVLEALARSWIEVCLLSPVVLQYK